MGLKEEFLSYCEYQRTADEVLRTRGGYVDEVVEAFEKANTMKKSIMDKLEAIDEACNY
jgi:hypothetical protein